MEAKYLQAGLAHVDQEFVKVDGNTVTFTIADPDKGVPGCKDRDILKFAMSMYESVQKEKPAREGKSLHSAMTSVMYWSKAFMWVARNGIEARHPRSVSPRKLRGE